MYHMLDLLSWDGTPFSDLVCGTFIIATLCATVFFTKSRDDRERLLKARRRSDSVEGLVELHNDRVLNACAELFAGFDDRTPSSSFKRLARLPSMPVLPEADMEDLLPTPLTREVCGRGGEGGHGPERGSDTVRGRLRAPTACASIRAAGSQRLLAGGVEPSHRSS